VTSAGDIIAQRYRIESPLGEGGMGAVFRATHLELGRTVAIKLVRAEDPSEQALERFLREAKSAASVDHRNVVDVLDFGREAESARPYLVMECLAGESLEQRLKRPPPAALDEIIAWTAATLSGLAAIHDAGIVHRDLKPANVFLAEDADGIVPKVLDFGIARPSQEASALTHTMQTLGTPHYMSPEQVRSAKTVDARSDLYAIGVMLYLSITGKLPFDGPSATAVIAAIVTDDPVPLSELRPDVPRALARLVHKAMARQPADRFQSARAMRQALLDVQHGIDPGLSADRPSFTQAPTVMAGPPSGMSASGMSASGMSGSGTSGTPAPVTGASSPPRARTGRRGFFAMLGVLSTLLVAGLAGSMAMRGGSPRMESDAATMPPTPSGSRGLGGGGAARSEGVSAPTGMPAAVSPPVTVASDPGTLDPGTLDPGNLAIATPALPFDEAALRIRGLSAADRASVRFVAASGITGDGLTADGDDVDRYWILAPSSLFSALSAPPSGALASGAAPPIAPPPDAARYVPLLLETNVRANLRERADEDATLLTTLPRGTLVVALEAESPEDAEAPRWRRVVVARGLTGFIATSLLDGYVTCVPDATTIGRPETWIARAQVTLSGVRSDALLLFDPESGGTLRVVSVDLSCHARPIASFHLESGQISDLFLTRTGPEGDTLVVIGRWPERDHIPANGLMSWSVHALTEPARVLFALDLPSGQNLPDARRAGIGGPIETGGRYFPIQVRTRGRLTQYVWDGSTLVPVTERDPLAPAE
jgi:serine/threonine protein kinase